MPIRTARTMPFVRFPCATMDMLLKRRFSGVAWSILIWTARNTYGWDRETVRFSWYRIAKELRIDRSGVVRAGRGLVGTGVLLAHERRLAIALPPSVDQVATKWASGTEDARQRKRGQQASLFRRAKERRTEKNEYTATDFDHPAGAASPIPGKYGDIGKRPVPSMPSGDSV